MNNANFIAVDFETATPQRAACQIGIVVVKEGKIVDKVSRLIQPPKNKYSDRCIKVHGITPDMTANLPTFDILWNEIKDYFERNFIVAHNAAFDLDVLYKSLDTYNIPHPIFMGTTCTYQLSGLSLEDACNKYDILLNNHHDGACDAEACAKLFLKYLNGEINFQRKNKFDIEDDIIIEDDESNPFGIKLSFNRYSGKDIEKEYLCEDPLAFIDEDIISNLTPLSCFQDKKFIITGETLFDRERAYKIITSLGGKKSSSVCKSLDYVIIGKEPGPKKMKKIEELINNGYNINILFESDFLSLLKSSVKLENNE